MPSHVTEKKCCQWLQECCNVTIKHFIFALKYLIYIFNSQLQLKLHKSTLSLRACVYFFFLEVPFFLVFTLLNKEYAKTSYDQFCSLPRVGLTHAPSFTLESVVQQLCYYIVTKLHQFTSVTINQKLFLNIVYTIRRISPCQSKYPLSYKQ